jgi:hypothetical protein
LLMDLAKRRRKVYELTLQDLHEFAAWEFASDEEGAPDQDEATVRPYLKVPIDPSDGALVVRAIFTLADGSECTGFLSPPPPNGFLSPPPPNCPRNLGDLQPTIIASSGQVPLWFGLSSRNTGRISVLLNMLGKSAAQVFPLSYMSDAPLCNGPINGKVAGFAILHKGKVQVVWE